MKAISASIIVLAATILVAAGGIMDNRETQRTIFLISMVIGIIGLSTWYKALKETDDK